MRAVNLLPRETRSKKLGWNSELTAGIVFTLLLVVALVGGFVVERSHAASERQRLATAQAALDRANSHLSEQARLKVPDVLSQAQPWHLALDSALSTRVSWDVLLAQLEYVVPARVGLTTVSFGSAPGATGATTATVSLGGNASSLHDVAVFLSTLAHVPTLSQVTLNSTAANTGGAKVFTFQITAQVILPAAVVAPSADATTTGGQT